jgi:two-component system sensor histidine kinase TctE
VNQLLSLARAEPIAGRVAPARLLDLRQLAREATTDCVPRALARNIDLGFDEASSAAYVEGDPFLLREMLNNVLDNAIRYTQRGGQVTVHASTGAAGPTLLVEDNGPGIPAAERARVSERFYRVLGTGTEGCGLGLAIVSEIAQSHGAQVSLNQGPDGKGTVVKIVFPAASELRPDTRAA